MPPGQGLDSVIPKGLFQLCNSNIMIIRVIDESSDQNFALHVECSGQFMVVKKFSGRNPIAHI